MCRGVLFILGLCPDFWYHPLIRVKRVGFFSLLCPDFWYHPLFKHSPGVWCQILPQDVKTRSNTGTTARTPRDVPRNGHTDKPSPRQRHVTSSNQTRTRPHTIRGQGQGQIITALPIQSKQKGLGVHTASTASSSNPSFLAVTSLYTTSSAPLSINRSRPAMKMKMAAPQPIP